MPQIMQRVIKVQTSSLRLGYPNRDRGHSSRSTVGCLHVRERDNGQDIPRLQGGHQVKAFTSYYLFWGVIEAHIPY